MASALPADLAVGPVAISVTDLDRSIGFYESAIGLHLNGRDEASAALGAGGTDVLRLVLAPDARRPGREAGLYHFCLLFPTREELARAATRVATTQTPIQGASDHGTHEAIYLPDPDGNGIELAADRPREAWPDMRSPAGYAGGPHPLDTQSLLATVDGQSIPAEAARGLAVGHVHLHVGDITEAIAFYRDVVGFELMVDLGTAAFMSIGGYHHRVAANVWRGEGVGPARPSSLGLREWSIVLREATDLDALRARLEAAGAPVEDRPSGLLTRDPWDIPLVASVA